MNDLLATEIYAGRTIGDYLSLEFLASVVGSVIAAILILVVGLIISGWVGRKIQRIAIRNWTIRCSSFWPISRATSS